ncbi:MAG: antibiotic biosynthesis monooxygenase [Acidimicrobiia bacterium]|nr:antibiotic biosynthesis monooxygenase [Acidimicrobiia bacterium]
MLLIAGTITLDPRKIDEAMEAAVTMMKATHEEPGNIEYVFSVDPIREGIVHVFEKWDGEESLAAHFGARHMAEFQAKVPSLGITGMDIRKYEIASEGPIA